MRYAVPLEENTATYYNPLVKLWQWEKILASVPVLASICDDSGSYWYQQKSVTSTFLSLLTPWSPAPLASRCSQHLHVDEQT